MSVKGGTMISASILGKRAGWAIVLLLAVTTPLQAAINFVQQNSNAPFTTISSITATYTAAQAAGDLNVVVISWEASAGSVQSISDSSGNTYTAAVGPTLLSGIANQTIYYAKNIHAAAANANTITVTFAAA